MSALPNNLENFVARESARAEFLASAFLERQIARLETHFPSRHWRETEWLNELCRIVADFGEERAEAGITDCICRGGLRDDGSRNCSFPPTIAELRNCVPPPAGKRFEHPSGCKACDDTGWVSADPGNSHKGVKRCPNYRQIGAA